MQYLDPYLQLNLITFFTTIEDLFNYLKDIFDNLHQKNHAMKKFWDSKMGINLFNDFYSEFIHLTLNLNYISKMLVHEFKYKLILYL